MNYDGNIINITNSPNVLHPSSWTPNTFFANSGSNQYSGANWSGNGIGAYMQTGYGAWHNAAQDYEPRVDLSVTRGKHAMKFGFSYNRYTKNQQLQANAAGVYGFGQNQTGTGAGGNAGDPFMSMLLGLSTSYYSAAVDGDPALRQPDSVGVCLRQLEGDPSAEPATRFAL